ncbi:MAG TPA: Ig-like domain-containing protein [Methanomassiliicoccales archaeon]|jgi:hypothetical protein
MKRPELIGLLLVAVVAAILIAPVLAFNGGAGSGNQEIGCAGTSKHSGGSATIVMGGSPMNPAAGQQVSVWVNVTGGATVGRLYGVMIVSALTAPSLPINDGWTVVTDPSTTANNYVEKTVVAGTNSFKWTLTAPGSGSHTLYSKAFYAQGGNAATIYTQGLIFNVGGTGGGVTPSNTSVTISSPTAGSSVTGSVNISANLVNPAGISYAVLRIDGAVVSNLTAATYMWTWNTTQYADGIHTINITAAGKDGTFGYAQSTVTVSNAAVQILDQNAWQWTAIALMMSSIAVISVITVLILIMKKRRMGGGD